MSVTSQRPKQADSMYPTSPSRGYPKSMGGSLVVMMSEDPMIIAAAIICLGLVIIAVSYARRR